jgi:hypothetical protein
MNSTATLIKSSDWGVLGSKINEITVLEKILRSVGHNSIRCINTNGCKLANIWLKEERDDRARAVEGSKENWTAYNVVCLMVEKNMDSLNPNLPITVRGNCDVLVVMVRAAFGHCVLGGTLPKHPYLLGASMTDDTYDAYDIEEDFHPLSRDRFSHAMVFQNAFIYLRDVGVVTHINHVIDKQPILEWNNSSGLLYLSPFYTLTGTFNINSISQSMKQRIDGEDTETMIVKTICEVRDLYDDITHFNRKFEPRIFYTSLARLLPPDNLDRVLDEDSMRDLIASGLFPDTEGRIYHNILQVGNQPAFPVQIRKLWEKGPLFCLINDEVENTTYLFSTPRFPEIL